MLPNYREMGSTWKQATAFIPRNCNISGAFDPSFDLRKQSDIMTSKSLIYQSIQGVIKFMLL